MQKSSHGVFLSLNYIKKILKCRNISYLFNCKLIQEGFLNGKKHYMIVQFKFSQVKKIMEQINCQNYMFLLKLHAVYEGDNTFYIVQDLLEEKACIMNSLAIKIAFLNKQREMCCGYLMTIILLINSYWQ